MASAIYPSALDAFLKGQIALLTDDIRCALIDLDTYTYSGAHDFLNDVSGIVAQMSTGLTGKSVSGGAFFASDPTIASVSGADVEAVIVYKHTGTSSTANLLCFIDTEPDGTTPISFTPNGSGVTINFPVGGIFSI